MTADVFAVLNLLKKSGLLVIEHTGALKQIWWQEGEVVFAASSSPTDSLGEFLVRHGRITRAQAETAFAQAGVGRRQGRVLVEMGLITPRQLWWAVRNQVLEIIYALFNWKTGHFRFFDGEVLAEEKIQLAVSAANLKAERARLGLSQERAAERVGFSLQYLQRIERCIVNVPLDTLVKFARGYGVEPVELLMARGPRNTA